MAAKKGSIDLAAGTLGGDLPSTEQTAYQEGLDADTPSIGALVQHLQGATTAPSAFSKDSKPDTSEVNGQSGATSIDGGQAVTSEQDPEKAPAATATTEAEEDPNIVYWDGPDDPENPLNWTAGRKWGNIFVLSALTFFTPLASSMFAPGVPQLMKDFNSSSNILATFVVSVYVLGFAFGPLVVAPASELYGRRMVYHISNIGFLIFTVACALAPNLNAMIVFRFLQGCFGVTPVTIGGGTIADLMIPEKRGGAMAIWAMGPLLGPVAGPVAGGFLSVAKGWRWIFWLIAMASGAFSLLAVFTLRETYAPVLLERKAARLRQSTGNSNLRSKLDNGLNPNQLFLRAIVRPTKLMFLSPICGLMSVYMAIVYAFLYLLLTTFTYVFEDAYGFSSSTVGLVYLGLGIGSFVGLAILGFSSDRIMNGLAKKNGDAIRPEYRLPMLMYLGPCVPIGLFIYGWTAQYSIQWAVPLFGTLIVGIGVIAVMMGVNTYLVDTFTLYAASAMASNTVLRSMLGGLFPLFGLEMYNGLGLGWGNSLLAFLGVALCPIPWFFYRYGERIRTHPKWQIKF